MYIKNLLMYNLTVVLFFLYLIQLKEMFSYNRTQDKHNDIENTLSNCSRRVLKYLIRLASLRWVAKQSQFCPAFHRTRELNSITATANILLGLILHYHRRGHHLYFQTYLIMIPTEQKSQKSFIIVTAILLGDSMTAIQAYCITDCRNNDFALYIINIFNLI